MGDFDLFCHEAESCFNENNTQHQIFKSDFDLDDDDYIKKLFEKESNFVITSTKMDQIDLKCARLDAIQWILNTRSVFGFHFRTAHLSLVYLDIFLSNRSIDDRKIWAIRLLSVACLSLAAKMEECERPPLSEYHVDEYNFKGNIIKNMELLILTTLDWKMNLITPFSYLDYFITKFCDKSTQNEVNSKATDLIFDIVKEVNLAEIRPSIIAGAAVLAAYDNDLTREMLEFKMSIISSWSCIEKEKIVWCYKLVQKREMLISKTRNHEISSKLSDSKSSEIFSFTSAIGTKRTLTYIGRDQHCPPSKNHRS